MKYVTLTKDLRDDEGRLLLAKGKQVAMTAENVRKFRSYGVFDKTNELKKQHKKKKTVVDIEKISICSEINFDNKMFCLAVDHLNEMIFESKKTQWYVHFHTLANYADWLYSHSINTALISIVMGSAMKLDEEMIKDLAVGALLHDIGLLLVPSSILNKEDLLTNEESQAVEQHCILGKTMLEGTEVSEMSKKIILQHHEKLDGSGYPNNFTERQICLGAKIVMTADAFDAGTTARPYKKTKRAYTVLKELRSTHLYDEKTVKTLSAFIDDCSY